MARWHHGRQIVSLGVVSLSKGNNAIKVIKCSCQNLERAGWGAAVAGEGRGHVTNTLSWHATGSSNW